MTQCNSYVRLATEVANKSDSDGQDIDIDTVSIDNDGGEDKEIAAMGVAQTIGTVSTISHNQIRYLNIFQVVSAVDTSPEILAQVQEVIIPIIVFTLEKELMGMSVQSLEILYLSQVTDLFDNMYDLVDSLTFKLRRISPSMWQVFELTYKALQSHAINWMEGQFLPSNYYRYLILTRVPEMMPALDNFLSYGSDVFKTRQDYKNMVLDVYTKCLNSSQLGESDFINGCKLADSILLNLRGCVDDVSFYFCFHLIS